MINFILSDPGLIFFACMGLAPIMMGISELIEKIIKKKRKKRKGH